MILNFKTRDEKLRSSLERGLIKITFLKLRFQTVIMKKTEISSYRCKLNPGMG